MFILYVILYRCFKVSFFLHGCPLSYLWFYCIMYQIELICVTGQHGRTVVLLNAFTLYKYIWNKKNQKKQWLSEVTRAATSPLAQIDAWVQERLTHRSYVFLAQTYRDALMTISMHPRPLRIWQWPLVPQHTDPSDIKCYVICFMWSLRREETKFVQHRIFVG